MALRAFPFIADNLILRNNATKSRKPKLTHIYTCCIQTQTRHAVYYYIIFCLLFSSRTLSTTIQNILPHHHTMTQSKVYCILHIYRQHRMHLRMRQRSYNKPTKLTPTMVWYVLIIFHKCYTVVFSAVPGNISIYIFPLKCKKKCYKMYNYNLNVNMLFG